MACGTPVVTSNSSSLPEVVGDAGLMVPPTDSEALATAILQVLQDDNLRESLHIRGLQRARSFSWHETAERTRKAYEQVGKSLV
jgi:glycosyltransferase involved in cell wall biosynthesis